MKFKVAPNRLFILSSMLKITIILVTGVWIQICTGVEASAQNMNVATYNILYYTPADHENSWEKRKAHVANIIRFHDINLWGSQEATQIQLRDLTEMLGHEYVGVARDDGATEGEYSAILYDPALFRVLKHDTFWLSRTPDKPSMDWGANFRRICTWGMFEHIKSGKTFYVYNAHFDHESQVARENSSRMVLNHIDENTTGDDSVIFMGDLNAVPGNETYQKVIEYDRLHDAYQLSAIPPHGPSGTFNGFSFTQEPDRRIDHIFLSDHFKVNRYGVLTDSYDGLNYPSDHFPVLTEIEF